MLFENLKKEMSNHTHNKWRNDFRDLYDEIKCDQKSSGYRFQQDLLRHHVFFPSPATVDKDMQIFFESIDADVMPNAKMKELVPDSSSFIHSIDRPRRDVIFDEYNMEDILTFAEEITMIRQARTVLSNTSKEENSAKSVSDHRTFNERSELRENQVKKSMSVYVGSKRECNGEIKESKIQENSKSMWVQPTKVNGLRNQKSLDTGIIKNPKSSNLSSLNENKSEKQNPFKSAKTHFINEGGTLPSKNPQTSQRLLSNSGEFLKNQININLIGY